MAYTLRQLFVFLQLDQEDAVECELCTSGNMGKHELPVKLVNLFNVGEYNARQALHIGRCLTVVQQCLLVVPDARLQVFHVGLLGVKQLIHDASAENKSRC